MKRIILEQQQVDLILTRICHQLVEDHGDFSNTAILALQPKGTPFGKALVRRLEKLFSIKATYGELDTTVTLINRKYKREVPIQPDYIGEHIDSRTNDYVKVEWEENKCKVWIITDTDK